MKILYILIFFFISNCSFNKVIKHHGVHFLDKKNEILVVNKSNKNDIITLLGQPSTQSQFDNDVWIYVERKISRGRFLDFGQNVLIKNNVLVLELDTKGLLVKKDFSDINDMKELQFSQKKTADIKSKGTFIYDFLSSLRQKINDPLGKRKKKQ